MASCFATAQRLEAADPILISGLVCHQRLAKNNNNNNKSICKKNNRKKDCQKAKTCDWDGKVCNNDKNNRVSSINEKVGAEGFIMTQLDQPTSDSVVTKISTIFGCAFMATWYQWN
mmetsp:Transcript_38177/g.66958  ORF Transcript_38177/g.66958 Transcript_38177/m.66958 type:complete len:116 (+) Transcript_38177:189-536(+)